MGPDYPNRRAKLLRRLKTIEVDGLIISNPANVRYLTGFTGDSAWLFLNLTNCVILSDTRYATQLADECPDIDMEIRDSGSTMSVLAAKIVAKATAEGFVCGVDMGRMNPEWSNRLLVCTTELHTKKQIDELADFLRRSA